jgi:hypothetical protein
MADSSWPMLKTINDTDAEENNLILPQAVSKGSVKDHMTAPR